MKKTTDLSGTSKGYKVFSVAILVVMVIFFLFPLYWIVTGSFKNKLEITARTPIWFPIEPTVENYARLFDNPAFLWLFNIIFISAAAMILTCITASLAGYALGKKRFIGRGVLFTIIICAMALPKQVIVIPLVQEMTNIFHLNDTLWAVILPTVGWPFGVFLMKQFSETIPGQRFWRPPGWTARVSCAPSLPWSSHDQAGHRRPGHLHLREHMERLLPPAGHAQQRRELDAAAGHCPPSGRDVH